MKASSFVNQARLMLRVLPDVAKERCFALKGGTAINFFLRDMPRLSVDIDLTYIPIEPRKKSLKNISNALKRIAASIKSDMPAASIQNSTSSDGNIVKLFVHSNEALIKIEPNLTVRGAVFPVEEKDLSRAAQKEFEMYVSVPALSLADLYGGKICAALDRQHPRDIYDFKLLLENEGITKDVCKAFVIYLASHDRPMHEVLRPKIKDIKAVYDSEFAGMTKYKVSLKALIAIQKKMRGLILRELSGGEKRFLVSFKEGDPQWGLLGLKNMEKLPALQWKLLNIRKMSKAKHCEQLQKLKNALVI